MYPTPADLCCSRFNQEIIFEVFQTFDIRVGLRIATGYRVVALDMRLANQDLTVSIRLYPKVRRVLDLCQDFAGYIASLVEWRGSMFQKISFFITRTVFLCDQNIYITRCGPRKIKGLLWYRE